MPWEGGSGIEPESLAPRDADGPWFDSRNYHFVYHFRGAIPR